MTTNQNQFKISHNKYNLNFLKHLNLHHLEQPYKYQAISMKYSYIAKNDAFSTLIFVVWCGKHYVWYDVVELLVLVDFLNLLYIRTYRQLKTFRFCHLKRYHSTSGLQVFFDIFCEIYHGYEQDRNTEY